MIGDIPSSIGLTFFEMDTYFKSIKTIPVKGHFYKSGIYWITNIINGKCYIGSAMKLGDRRNDHFNDLIKNKHYNSRLQNAINKYGIKKFKFEIIEFCSPDKLIEREQNYFDILKPEYNICKVAGNMLGFKHSKKTKELLSNNQFKGKFGKENPFSIKCFQYDLDGKFVKEWGSICEVERQLNFDNSLIVRCLKGKTRTAHRNQWFYNYMGKKINPIKVKSIINNSKDKNKYNKVLKLINKGKTINEISKKLNLKENSLRGYIFVHKELNDKVKTRKWNKVDYNSVLKIIKEKKTINEISETLGLNNCAFRTYLSKHNELNDIVKKNRNEKRIGNKIL
jgi:group I intron endonuclease